MRIVRCCKQAWTSKMPQDMSSHKMPSRKCWRWRGKELSWCCGHRTFFACSWTFCLERFSGTFCLEQHIVARKRVFECICFSLHHYSACVPGWCCTWPEVEDRALWCMKIHDIWCMKIHDIWVSSFLFDLIWHFRLWSFCSFDVLQCEELGCFAENDNDIAKLNGLMLMGFQWDKMECVVGGHHF